VEQYHEKFVMKDNYLVFLYLDLVNAVFTVNIVTG